jgi:hypothetical protein
MRHLFHKRIVPWKEHIALWGIAELENLVRLVGFVVVKSEYVSVPEREKFEAKKHRYADLLVHKLSLCHALTGRSVQVTAKKAGVED